MGNVVSELETLESQRSAEGLLLLGGLLLLLLLLSICVFLFFYRCLFHRWGFFSLGFLLDSNEQADHVLGLDHVVLIDLELTEDVVNLSLGHLVSPGFQSVLEHLGANLYLVVVSLESLDNQVIGVVALSSHLLGEHLGHVLAGAGSTDLTQESIKLALSHQDTNVVEGATEVVFVQNTVLVDVHELEAVLVH